MSLFQAPPGQSIRDKATQPSCLPQPQTRRWGAVTAAGSSRGGNLSQGMTEPPLHAQPLPRQGPTPPPSPHQPRSSWAHRMKEPVSQETRAPGGRPGPLTAETQRHKTLRLSHRKPPSGPLPKLHKENSRSTALFLTPGSGRLLTIAR